MSKVGESYQGVSIGYPSLAMVTYVQGRIILPTGLNRISKLDYGHLYLKEGNLTKGLNRISKFGYGHLCLREENLTKGSQ